MYKTDDFSAFFDAVYSQDSPSTAPYGSIQWKGTDVCIYLHCKCGESGHIDGEFAYYYKCKCGLKYALGFNVKLIELTDEQASYAGKRHVFFEDM